MQEQVGDLDAFLVERARSGDHLAFRDLVLRHDAGLRALAFRLLQDRERMDDVLQEAYVKAFRGLPTFRGDAGVRTWLYRIVYNACMDELRRRPRDAQLSDSIPLGAATAPDPGDVVTLRSRLTAALALLPPDQRAAVVLVDAEGFDHGAAAAVLGVAAGTIASRVSRARAALRRTLGDGGEEF